MSMISELKKAEFDSLNRREDSGALQIFQPELPSLLCCLASKVQGVNHLHQCPKEYSSK